MWTQSIITPVTLQPENILLDESLNLKVSDFGFATVLGPNEELTGNHAGFPPY